jgi:acyl CoA:acetate/3-ketoacid CoA transferase
MRSKVITAREAAALVKDGDVLALHGAGGGNVEPDLLIKTLGERYLETKTPRNLTIFHVSGLGDRKTTGLGTKLTRTGEALSAAITAWPPAKLVLEDKLKDTTRRRSHAQWLREVAAVGRA